VRGVRGVPGTSSSLSPTSSFHDTDLSWAGGAFLGDPVSLSAVPFMLEPRTCNSERPAPLNSENATASLLSLRYVQLMQSIHSATNHRAPIIPTPVAHASYLSCWIKLIGYCLNAVFVIYRMIFMNGTENGKPRSRLFSAVIQRVLARPTRGLRIEFSHV